MGTDIYVGQKSGHGTNIKPLFNKLRIQQLPYYATKSAWLPHMKKNNVIVMH